MLRESEYVETEEIAEDLCNSAEDVNLWSAPGDLCYVNMIDSRYCIPTAWWICETSETSADWGES
jgi:hypothetical protein